MVVILIMSALCTAGVAFYVRFFVALCKECKRTWIGYSVRIQPEANEYQVMESHDAESSFAQAA